MTGTAAPIRGSAYTVWAVGLAIYVLAVFHRSSLAVAGLVATDRFEISAAQLATFTMLQLLVYAVMQVPVGLLVDRFGARSVLLAGALVLSAAQAGFAVAESYPAALVARFFVGLGDAMTFICVIRIVSLWFPARRIPLLTQLTGTVGQLGAVAAAVPMTWALSSFGWTRAYLVTASFGVLLAALGAVLLRDSPAGRHLRGSAMSLAAVRASLRASWSHPGTRLGFWIHFTAQCSATTMALLWGYPFFVRGEGRTSAEAGLLLTLIVVAIVLAGPLLGWFVARHPWHRSSMVLVIVGAIVAAWTAVLAWPGEAPFALLVVLVLVIGIGGPGSLIGFDVGRTSNPAERMGSATGIINLAGFVASLGLVVAIGLVLDWHAPGPTADYGPADFRWAMSVQYVVWGLGLVQILRYRRRTRRIIDREALEAGALV